MVATAGIDGAVNLWETATGKQLKPFRGHVTPLEPVPCLAIAFSPDGQYIASGSMIPNIFDLRQSRGEVRIWEVDTQRVVATFTEQVGLITSVAFNHDGSRVASSSINAKNSFAVWDVKTRKTIRTMRGHTGQVHRVRYSPDGQLIASASTDGSVKLWNADTFQEIRSVDAHPAPVFDVAFDRDGKRFASAGLDGTACIWETASGKRLQVLRGHASSAVGVAFSPDGKRIATAGFDKTARLWDPTTGEEKITLRGHRETVFGVDFSPDGRQLVTASFDGTAESGMPPTISFLPGPTCFRFGTTTASTVSLSAPTVSAWPRAVGTISFASGMRKTANPSRLLKVTTGPSGRWPSARTASGWRRQAGIEP